MIGAFVLATIPLTAGYYPGGPETELAMKINGEWSIDYDPYIFEGIVECTTFEVEIMVVDAEDLYAYSFVVDWSGAADYIELTDYELKHIHTDDFVIKSEYDDVACTYEQAVTAINPAVGFDGTAALANLWFHICNDAQWPDQVDLVIYLTGDLADSCDQPIPHSEQPGYIKLDPVQPVIKMLPPVVYKSVVGETFEVQFEIQNVVKMKSFHFEVTWDPTQLTTDAQNVWIKDFLPPPYEETYIYVGEWQGVGFLDIEAWMPCEKPYISGTGELFGIRFTTLNPWDDCNKTTPDIPPYLVVEADPPKIPHPIWYPDVCWNWINIGGYIDKGCGECTHYQYLGDPNGVSVKGPDKFDIDDDPDTKFLYDEPCEYWEGQYIIGYYEFRPIPGDLNMDGHVDIEDLSAIAKCYGATPANSDWNYCDDFDLDDSDAVDIFDVVIVAKNFCRTEPDPELPDDIFDP